MRRSAMVLALVLLAGCEPSKPPPPSRSFGGLPVSGNAADAKKAGFTNCSDGRNGLVCRRDNVMLLGQGPYNAALDMIGSDGSGGFAQLTLWHDGDQMAVQAVGNTLEREGWHMCLTGTDERGDLEIYSRPGAAVRAAIDISYWGKRRLRIIPEGQADTPQC